MKKNLAVQFCSVLAAVLAVSNRPAPAATIFSQPPLSNGSLSQSAVSGTDYDQMTWDDFRLTNSVAITEIRWRGGYIYGGSGGPVTNWTVAIYSDIANGYQPDIINPPLVTYTVSGNASETLAGTFGGTTLYDYAFVLPSPFQAVANQFYWVLIQANQHTVPDWAIALGSGGNSRCFRRVAGVGDWYFYIGGFDCALTLLTSDLPTVNIAATAAPANGGTVIGAGPYPAESTASLTARPAAGYGFVNWTEDGTPVSTSANYQFTASTPRTLVANFAPSWTITTSASPNYGGTTSGGGTFNDGTSVTVTATAGSGYVFVNWTEFGTPVSTSASYTFTASANRALVANFAAAPATVSFDFDTATPVLSPGQGMPSTQTKNGITASFTPLSGSWFISTSFYGWVPGVFSGNFLYPTTYGSTFAVQFSQPITNLSLAFFTGDVSSEYDTPTTMRISAYTNSASTQAVAVATGKGDWLTGAYPEGTLSISSATPFTIAKIDMPSGQGLVSYIFWADNIVVQEAPVPPVTITATAAPAGAGTITGAGSFAPGTTVGLTATAHSGYQFVDWTEGGVEVSTSPTYSFTATANRTLVANYIAVASIIAIAAPSNGGSIFGDGVFTNGAAVYLSASAAPGYAFVNWTENGTIVGSQADYTFTATTDRLLQANFVFQPPPLQIQQLGNAIVLTWPTNTGPFTLQANPVLNSANWATATNAVNVSGSNYQVTVPTTGTACFFRLAQ